LHPCRSLTSRQVLVVAFFVVFTFCFSLFCFFTLKDLTDKRREMMNQVTKGQKYF
jgi:hypothetical protein